MTGKCHTQLWVSSCCLADDKKVFSTKTLLKYLTRVMLFSFTNWTKNPLKFSKTCSSILAWSFSTCGSYWASRSMRCRNSPAEQMTSPLLVSSGTWRYPRGEEGSESWLCQQFRVWVVICCQQLGRFMESRNTMNYWTHFSFEMFRVAVPPNNQLILCETESLLSWCIVTVLCVQSQYWPLPLLFVHHLDFFTVLYTGEW